MLKHQTHLTQISAPLQPKQHTKNNSLAHNNEELLHKNKYNQLLEPDFPTNHVKWNKSLCPPPCKGVYTWISSPKALYNNKKLVKNEIQEITNQPQNIMYDKRIVRGSNYGQNQTNTTWNPYFSYAGLLSGKGDLDAGDRETEVRRRHQLRKRHIQRNQRNVIGTPPPVKGRRHETIQTEKYLEELFSRPPEFDVQCQTDLYLHRPPSPPYVSSKTCVDAVTEILRGELFDFDVEVQPILDVLVGRSIEQGLMEVMHEEELAEMRNQQEKFLAIREAEMAELRRLEAKEIRLKSEQIRRHQQEQVAQKSDQDMHERITAAKLLQGHIADLLPDILNSIEPFLETENQENLEKTLGPWLAQEVAQEVGQMVDSRDLLEEIVREILEDRAARFIKMAENDEIKAENEKEQSTDNAIINETVSEPQINDLTAADTAESKPIVDDDDEKL